MGLRSALESFETSSEYLKLTACPESHYLQLYQPCHQICGRLRCFKLAPDCALRKHFLSLRACHGLLTKLVPRPLILPFTSSTSSSRSTTLAVSSVVTQSRSPRPLRPSLKPLLGSSSSSMVSITSTARDTPEASPSAPTSALGSSCLEPEPSATRVWSLVRSSRRCLFPSRPNQG